MSWLFDQLTELATADRVEVVVGIDLTKRDAAPGSIDVVDLIVRAARLPKLTMLLLPTQLDEPTLPLESAHVVELEPTGTELPGPTVAQMLATQRRHCGAVLRVDHGCMSLEPYGRLPDPERPRAAARSETAGWIFATEDPTMHPDLDALDELGPPALRISIGCMNPNANVTIRDASGFVSLLDALVTLREFANEGSPLSLNDNGAPGTAAAQAG